jgi:uncharacterized protein YacL
MSSDVSSNIFSIIYIFISIVLGYVLISTVFYQYKETNHKKLFLIISLVATSALVLTYVENGRFEQDKDKDLSKWTACDELNRVCWRRALSISFIIFLISNSIYPNSLNNNFLLLLITTFILYFYFNYDIYHRFKAICDKQFDKVKIC